MVSKSWLLWIKLQWPWVCRYLLKVLISFPSCEYPGVCLLNNRAVLFLIFWGTTMLYSLLAVLIYFAINKCTIVLFSPHSDQHFLSLVFVAIITDVRWFLIVALICSPIMISEIEHLFTFLLIICVSYLEKCLFRSWKVNCLFLWCWVIWVLCIFWILTPYEIYDLQISYFISMWSF